MKQRIKSSIWNIKKQNAPNQNNKKKESKTNEDSVRYLWDNFKYTNIQIMGMSEGEEWEEEIENLFEKHNDRKLP